MRTDLPTGTVTLLFTDVEGSTGLLHELGDEAYATALAEHRRLLRAAFAAHGGVEVDTEGDAFFVAFSDPGEAVTASAEAQKVLASGPIRVRMGLHTGVPRLTEEGYVGADIHKGARIAAAAHGGQVVLSKETRQLLGNDVELLDLGEHRVKDFAAPVWIYQLGDERFPPLRTISNTNLPRPASSFIGRAREVAEIGSLLRDGARLVTLTGPGGTGKTRLAIEAAAELIPAFRNGVFWVGLAALRDPALVQETIGRSLGAKNGLAEYVGEREMLLLLDNLEQVVAAAPGLAQLVEACPNLRLLATSRERLRVRGETEYAVPPLAETDAVTLFCERSDLNRDETIAELCRRLDDLPLAVELAAARTSVLTPSQILARLSQRLDLLKGGRDAEARQATLRATIEWSHDLLTPEERRLFARLSVFRGGCALEAAEQVAEAGIDSLQSLVDKSLLRRRDERFAMLETIREFAAQRLEASGEGDELGRRHAEFFVALVGAAEPHLRLDESEWVERLERDHDNLRALLDRLAGTDDTQALLDLNGKLYRFWYLRSDLKEGQRYLEAAIRADDRATAPRALALAGAAVMALNLGEHHVAQARAEAALALYRDLGDGWGQAYAAMMVGNALKERSKDGLAEAVPFFMDAIRRFDDMGDEHFALITRYNLAWVVGSQGDSLQERGLYEEILRRARAAGEIGRWSAPGPVARTVAFAKSGLAMLERDDGRLEMALELLCEAIGTDLRLGWVQELAVNLGRLANVLALGGEADRPAQLMAKSDDLFEELGASRAWWDQERNDETRAILRTRLDERALGEATRQGRRLKTEEAVALALGSEAQERL